MSAHDKDLWRKIDLHVHPPNLSNTGQERGTLLDTLRRAEERSLDMIGLVDHNSVRGYEQLRLEMSRLTVLKEAGRLSAEDEAILSEYQRLLAQIILLPGFEVTTQDGIHLLALFPPETPAERLYALLLNLGIAMDRLREGSVGTRTLTDLNTACALIAQAGGIVIATHVDSNHRKDLGQEADWPEGLLALEVNSLPEELPAGPLPFVWFSGANCRQSLAQGIPAREVGDRYSEAPMEEPSFPALHNLLLQKDPGKLRFPEQERLRAHLERLRRQGAERLILYENVDPEAVHQDIAALANAGGGVLMIGLTEEAIVGVEDPESLSATLSRTVRQQVDPAPRLNLELLRYGGKEVIRVEVHTEEPPPYLTTEGAIYVRRAEKTRPATRQELCDLLAASVPASAQSGPGGAPSAGLDLPQAGVEIVGAYLRDGAWFYDVRDLRVTSGVTRQRAKGLWAYAIERQEALRQGRADLSQVRWKGDCGVWRAYRSGERRVFDLVHRDASGRLDHIFFGVSEWGLTPRWRDVVESVRPPLEDEPDSTLEGENDSDARKFRPLRAPRRPTPINAAPPETTAAEPGPTPTVEDISHVEAVVEANHGAPPTPASVESQPPEQTALPEKGPEEIPAPAKPAAAQLASVLIRPSPDAWGGRLPRWRGQAAVERVYSEGSNLLFDLSMRQADGQVRYFRRVSRKQLSEAEGWIDLVRVPLPPSGVEVVRSTVSGEEVLYQFRDMQTGRVDPRVRRKSDFSEESPYAYAIRMYHQDAPLDDEQVRWWGNVGYLRSDEERADLVYRDEEGRDHIYYAADRALLDGEWQELLQVWADV